MNYYSNKSHAGHEILGAKIAGKLLGKKYYTLVLEHRVFNIKLEKPDEYSHTIMPLFILKCLWLIERKRFMSPVQWKKYNKDRWNKRIRGEKMEDQWKECYGSMCTKDNTYFCTHHTAELLEEVNTNCSKITCTEHKMYKGEKKNEE